MSGEGGDAVSAGVRSTRGSKAPEVDFRLTFYPQSLPFLFSSLSHPHGVFSPGEPGSGSTLDPHTIVERGGTGVGVTSPPG